MSSAVSLVGASAGLGQAACEVFVCSRTPREIQIVNTSVLRMLASYVTGVRRKDSTPWRTVLCVRVLHKRRTTIDRHRISPSYEWRAGRRMRDEQAEPRAAAYCSTTTMSNFTL